MRRPASGSSLRIDTVDRSFSVRTVRAEMTGKGFTIFLVNNSMVIIIE